MSKTIEIDAKQYEDCDDTTTRQAIERSLSHNEIVHIDLSDLDGDMSDLVLECDDHVENGKVHEFWGTTEAGDEWRVHVELDK